ncbi:GGDEF domain-containing protein [Yersinia ruckeri]|nr:GGDEF domain-containing protein [Yersinia ruckeri]
MTHLESLSLIFNDACITYASLSISYFALSKNTPFSYHGQIWKRALFGLVAGLVSLHLNQDKFVITTGFFYSFEVLPIVLATFYGGWVSTLIATVVNIAFTDGFTLDNLLILFIVLPLLFSKVWTRKNNRVFYTTILLIMFYRLAVSAFFVDYKDLWPAIMVFQLSSTLCLAICYHALNFKERHIHAYFSMKDRANIDNLTRLNNRASVDFYLAQLHAQRRACGLLLMDLDKFKAINDNYGHAIGDQILTSVGAILKQTVRRLDFVGRFGGEEFIVITESHHPEHIKKIAECLRENVEQLKVTLNDGREMHVTISIGASLYLPSMSMLKAIEMADDALYQAKNQGRNQVVYSKLMPFSQLGDRIRSTGKGYQRRHGD